uniref:Xrn1 helical domain-containing protein n=1 Tax=Arion vulgaris TaxID=1028688 RepID=A0A0B7BM97_9EUPU
MTDPESPIIDFYPSDFKIDLNGKKFAWQGVALLPFVEETRLRKTLESVYPDLTTLERKRNIRGEDRLFIGIHHPAYAFLEGLYEGQTTTEPVPIDTKLTQGMAGNVWCDDYNIEKDGVVPTPLPGVPDIYNNKCMTVCYHDLKFDSDHLFKAVVLPGAVMPAPTLKADDWNNKNPNQRYRPQIGFQPNSGYRDNKDMSAAKNMIRNSSGGGNQGFRGAGIMGAVPGSYGNFQQSRASNNHGYQRGHSSQGGQSYGGQGYSNNRDNNYRSNQSSQDYGRPQQHQQRSQSSYGNSYGNQYQSQDRVYQSYPTGQSGGHGGQRQSDNQHHPRQFDANRGRQQQDHGQNERYRPY